MFIKGNELIGDPLGGLIKGSLDLRVESLSVVRIILDIWLVSYKCFLKVVSCWGFFRRLDERMIYSKRWVIRCGKGFARCICNAILCVF